VTTEKYDPQAERWTETAYADAERYLRHRADVVIALGPPLVPGDVVLDLACGDGGFGEVLRARGLRYVGVDASEPMVEAARRRLGEDVHSGDLNDFRPEAPVAATTVFRAIYYARDRLAFFRQVGAYTEKKLVFDLNPRQYRLDDVRMDLEAAGFDRLDLRPFLVPQRVALPGPLAAALEAAEHTPLARLALRFRFTFVCAAFRG
jgi:SAM-dependent methyltransferase